jgi:hypothetical protein
MYLDLLAEGLCNRLETPVADGAGVSERKGPEVVDDEDKGARNGRVTGHVLDVSGLVYFVLLILVFDDGSGAKVSALRAGADIGLSLMMWELLTGDDFIGIDSRASKAGTGTG